MRRAMYFCLDWKKGSLSARFENTIECRKYLVLCYVKNTGIYLIYNVDIMMRDNHFFHPFVFVYTITFILKKFFHP